MGNYSQHLCMAIPNTTYYESLVMSTEVTREAVVDTRGLVHAPDGTGLGLPAGPDYPRELRHLVIDAAQSASIL
jgi:L-alanine-DL-glutamate epimerase-like enolase superfamily enzyme